MAYQRNTSRDYLARLEQQKKMLQAELELEQRELEAIRQNEADIARLNHKRALVKTQIRDAQQTRKLPPPIHGGPEGLKEATRESSNWDRRNRQRRAA